MVGEVRYKVSPVHERSKNINLSLNGLLTVVEVQKKAGIKDGEQGEKLWVSE